MHGTAREAAARKLLLGLGESGAKSLYAYFHDGEGSEVCWGLAGDEVLALYTPGQDEELDQRLSHETRHGYIKDDWDRLLSITEYLWGGVGMTTERSDDGSRPGSRL